MTHEIIDIYGLRKKLEFLEAKRGRHTELITVYVPDGSELYKTISKLGEERGTAENIKSKATMKNVTAALDKIISELRLFKKTPANGLVIFCGNVAEMEGQADFLLETLIPPKPISINLYRCSQKFVLEPLEEMLESTEVYGLLIVDRQEGDIGLLKGKKAEIVKKFESMIPGKFRAGGQSAQRFERVLEGMTNDFFKQIAESANKIFHETPNLKGIIIGGPGPTKQDFLTAGHLATDLQRKIIGQLDIGYTGESGIEELVNKAHEVLKETELAKEKQLVTKFLEHLGKGTGLATKDIEQIRSALQNGAVDIVLVSEKFKDEAIIDEFTALAGNTGASIEFISVETMEGQQLKAIGGIAVILRYKLN